MRSSPTGSETGKLVVKVLLKIIKSSSNSYLEDLQETDNVNELGKKLEKYYTISTCGKEAHCGNFSKMCKIVTFF